MLQTATKIVIGAAVIMWTIIILVFLIVTIYNKATGRGLKKSGANTTQDLHVQSYNINYEDVRAADVKDIINSDNNTSDNNANKSAKGNLCL